MTKEEILRQFPIVEKEDLAIWPEKVMEGLDSKNVAKIMEYLAEAPVSGEELLMYDLPAFLYPVEKFKALWETMVKRRGTKVYSMILEEEITPSDEFERMEKLTANKRKK